MSEVVEGVVDTIEVLASVQAERRAAAYFRAAEQGYAGKVAFDCHDLELALSAAYLSGYAAALRRGLPTDPLTGSRLTLI